MIDFSEIQLFGKAFKLNLTPPKPGRSPRYIPEYIRIRLPTARCCTKAVRAQQLLYVRMVQGAPCTSVTIPAVLRVCRVGFRLEWRYWAWVGHTGTAVARTTAVPATAVQHFLRSKTHHPSSNTICLCIHSYSVNEFFFLSSKCHEHRTGRQQQQVRGGSRGSSETTTEIKGNQSDITTGYGILQSCLTATSWRRVPHCTGP